MGRKYRIISSDGHVETPPEPWVRYVAEKYRDRAPRLIHLPDGKGDAWIVEGRPMLHSGQNITGPGPVIDAPTSSRTASSNALLPRRCSTYSSPAPVRSTAPMCRLLERGLTSARATFPVVRRGAAYHRLTHSTTSINRLFCACATRTRIRGPLYSLPGGGLWRSSSANVITLCRTPRARSSRP